MIAESRSTTPSGLAACGAESMDCLQFDQIESDKEKDIQERLVKIETAAVLYRTNETRSRIRPQSAQESDQLEKRIFGQSDKPIHTESNHTPQCNEIDRKGKKGLRLNEGCKHGMERMAETRTMNPNPIDVATNPLQSPDPFFFYQQQRK